jgi:signal transduction histidine kinase
MLILIANITYYNQNSESKGKIYLVEAKRIVKEIEKQKLEPSEIETMNLDKYDTIVSVRKFVAGETTENNYLVEEINGELYRIEYLEKRSSQLPIYINVILFSTMFVTIFVLVYVHNKVLKPFANISNLTHELAKGNLSMPIKEEKSRLFGSFLWGMNMLREKLEDNKVKELEFQKERKTLILSLSHDIKTPLSSIELYSKALAEDLFDTQEKKDEALQGIAKNVKEIKGYVDEIVTASREDFLKLEVNMGEYYLSEVMSNIESYYKEKLSVIHTEFQMDEVPEALVMGDSDRLVEVLQNVIENAIKYGDGKRISISFGEEEDCKLIHIKNSGCKLKTEELPNLFDSFYRGSNCGNMKGSGLGLYICRTLMKKMDGGIYAEIDGDVFCMTVVVRKV